MDNKLVALSELEQRLKALEQDVRAAGGDISVSVDVDSYDITYTGGRWAVSRGYIYFGRANTLADAVEIVDKVRVNR